MATWFSSDHHFFHKNILTYCQRPFSSLDEMHEKLIANWNSVVADDDDIFVLGDFCFGGVEKSISVLQQLRGHKHLIIGNHDFGGKISKAKKCGWESVEQDGWVQDGKRHIKLSHYPYHGDRGEEERFKERRLKDEGAWLLHGHVHQHWGIQGRQINVGVDVRGYFPISLATVLEIINHQESK